MKSLSRLILEKFGMEELIYIPSQREYEECEVGENEMMYDGESYVIYRVTRKDESGAYGFRITNN